MDERKTQRVVTDVQIEARIRGRSVTALVYDLSQRGCMIELPEPLVKPSDNLRLRFLDFEIGGCFAWEHGGCAGVSFYHEFDQTIVAHLGFKLRVVSFSEVQPRDRYGRPLPPPSDKAFRKAVRAGRAGKGGASPAETSGPRTPAYHRS